MDGENKKQLNFFDIFSMGFGSAIGSGIFVLLGIGIDYTGHSISLALVLACAMMLFAYISQIFMVSMFPLRGGTYSQSCMLLPPVMTGVNAIFLLVISTSLAVYATGVTSYLISLLPGAAPYSKLISVAVITLFFAFTIRGSKFVAIIQNIMTVVLICAIILFVVMGLPKVQPGYFSKEGFFAGGLGGFVMAISLMSYTCQGTTGGIALTAVTKKPTRTIPLAILADTVALAVLYALVGTVAAGVLPVEQVAGQNLTLVAQEIFPNALYLIFIICGAVFALTTSLMGAIAALRYPLQQVAEDGWLPKVFTKKTSTGYPWVIQLTFYLIAIIPIIFGINFDAIVSLVQAPTMLLNIYTNLVCMTIPKKYPQQWKRSLFHMPMPCFYALMGLGVLTNIFVAYNLFITLSPAQMIADLLALLGCVVLAIVRIKTGAVDVNKLLELKKAATMEAENYTAE